MYMYVRVICNKIDYIHIIVSMFSGLDIAANKIVN